MPIYEYDCQKCGTFETTQKITDKPLAKCPTCKGKVKKLISNTSFQLKGTGWYVTDYARKGKSNGEGNGSKSSSVASQKASQKANQRAMRRVNRRRAKVKNHPLRLPVQQAPRNDYPSGPKSFLFLVGNNAIAADSSAAFAFYQGSTSSTGVDLKSIFRYRWTVKQKIVEGGLFQWLRP